MVAIAVTLVIFVAAKIFLPFRISIILAVLTTAAGFLGSVVGAIVQAPFQVQAASLQSTQVVIFFTITIVSGCLAAGLAGWAYLRAVRNTA
jgi:hypothetical protein